jgi:dephospho-CoA kinase
MLKVGLTGGIGSGKTIAANVFEVLGIPVFYADRQAKELYHQKDIRDEIKTLFGQDIYYKTGKLNTSKLASVVFNDSLLLQKLNEVIHPAVNRKFEKWISDNQHKGYSYVIKEAAIIFETGHYKSLDKTITVYAPESLRTERVIKRDNLPREQIQKRMQSQMDDNQKMQLSDYVIFNDNKELVVPQILFIHNKINEIFKKM